MKLKYITILFLLLTPLLAVAAKDEVQWNKVLKEHYFADRTIQEKQNIIEIEAPYRAEDPALVPIKIISNIRQEKNRYIKKIIVLVDKNPVPFVGEFDLTPESGKADLAMRIRVNTYSYIRVIAEMNDGKLYMAKKYIKASGGCSAPIGVDLDMAMKRIGKMKFKVNKDGQANKPNLVQLLISHPNITGMQMDQITRFVRKPHFMDKLTVTFNDKPVLTAKTDIAISSDPNFRFYFMPKGKGVLKAEFTDISCESATSREVCSSGKSYSKILSIE